MLLNLRFQGESSDLSYLYIALFETYDERQINTKLIDVLHLQRLEFLEDHLLGLVVWTKTLLYECIQLLKLRLLWL